MRPLRGQHAPGLAVEGPPSRSVACPPAPITIAAPAHQIPRVQLALPVAVEPAARDEAEIQRRRSEPPRPLRRRRQRRELGHVVCTGLRVYGKPVTSSAPARPVDRRRRDRLAVERRAAAGRRPRERPAERGRLDDAQHRAASIAEAERHREQRHAVREVGRAVERIDVPDARARRGRPRVVPSSAMTRSSGNARREPLDDQRLGALVVLRDEVDVLGLEADGGPRPPPSSRIRPPRARSPAAICARAVRAPGEESSGRS